MTGFSRDSLGSNPADALPALYWCGRVAELEQSVLYTDAWTLASPVGAMARLSELGDVLIELTQPPNGGEAVVAIGRTTAYLWFGLRGRINLSLAAATRSDCDRALSRVRELLPKEQPSGCRVVIKQWSYRQGSRCHAETIDVCAWKDVVRNYHLATRAGLETMMQNPHFGPSGKLALWLGPPGTGKTWALRALAWEQRASMAVHYILDPEVFLERPDYVMSVFRGQDDDGEEQRARLIVLEDAGELLGADAMARTGHGLSRLLNLTDGLPGQASRTRVLITTNEEIGRLHPAVTRPGRCAALVRFAPLTESEARGWLEEHGVLVSASSSDRSADRLPRTLAELFHAVAIGSSRVLDDPGGRRSTKQVGFVSPSTS